MRESEKDNANSLGKSPERKCKDKKKVVVFLVKEILKKKNVKKKKMFPPGIEPGTLRV